MEIALITHFENDYVDCVTVRTVADALAVRKEVITAAKRNAKVDGNENGEYTIIGMNLKSNGRPYGCELQYATNQAFRRVWAELVADAN